MAVGTTNRLGLTTWSAGTDPLTRQQLLHDHQQLDLLAAIDLQVPTVGDRPPAGTRGRYCQALDTGVLYRDTGSAWVQIGTSQAAVDASVLAATATVVHDTATDADTLTDKSVTHYLTAASGNTNVPAGIGQYVAVDVTRLAATAIVQVAYSLLAPRIRWHRYYDGTSWSAWNRIGLSDLAAPTQSLAMGGYNITGLADPINAQDAATRAYVLSEVVKVAGVWSEWVPFTTTLQAVGGSFTTGMTLTTDCSEFANARNTSYRTRNNGKEVQVRIGAVIANTGASASPAASASWTVAASIPPAVTPGLVISGYASSSSTYVDTVPGIRYLGSVWRKGADSLTPSNTRGWRSYRAYNLTSQMLSTFSTQWPESTSGGARNEGSGAPFIVTPEGYIGFNVGVFLQDSSYTSTNIAVGDKTCMQHTLTYELP